MKKVENFKNFKNWFLQNWAQFISGKGPDSQKPNGLIWPLRPVYYSM